MPPPSRVTGHACLVCTHAASKHPSNRRTRAQTEIHTHTLSLSLSLTHTHTHTPSLTHRLTHTLTHTQVNAPSATTIPANKAGAVTQVFRISNPQHAEKRMLMRLKVEYSLNGTPFSEMSQVDSFPPGV